jgi:hypothetical protein
MWSNLMPGVVKNEFKLVIDLRDKPDHEHEALVVRLLRHAADRIESGIPFGGFVFDKDDRTGGGFAFRGKPKK